MRRVLLSLLVGLGPLTSASVASGDLQARQVLDRSMVRAMYRALPASVLGVVEPVRVVHVDSYRDGGTLLIRLQDRNGRELRACLDGRVAVPASERLMYLDALSPTDSTATPVLARGPEEDALFGVLARWAVDRPLPQKLTWSSDQPQADRIRAGVEFWLRQLESRNGVTFH